jgi:hypothetical protein
MSTTRSDATRLAAPLLAGGLLLASLAGCNINSHSVSCSGSS